MKQFLFYAVLICLIFSSCGDDGTKPTPISTQAAYSMIHHYYDSIVPKGDSNIIRFIRFQNTDMKSLFKKDAKITFWMAADTTTHQPTVLVEYDEDPHSPDPEPVFYSMSVFKIGICPPPNTPPCDGSLESLF
jgi:hypothetical protein